MPLDIPDLLPGPVFNLGCKTNNFSQTTGQLKQPGFKFTDASDNDREYNMISESSLASAKSLKNIYIKPL